MLTYGNCQSSDGSIHNYNPSNIIACMRLVLTCHMTEWSPIFKTACIVKKIWRIINTIVSIRGKNVLGYFFLEIICSGKCTVFLELRSPKTVRFSEQIMSTDKYPSMFLCQMEAIVYILQNNIIWRDSILQWSKFWFTFCAYWTPGLALSIEISCSRSDSWLSWKRSFATRRL